MNSIDHLRNMVLALNRIELYVNGISEDSFDRDIKTQDAVSCCIWRFGMAVSKLPKELCSRYYSEIHELDWCIYSSMKELEFFSVEDVWQIIFGNESGLLCNKEKIEKILQIENRKYEKDSSDSQKVDKNNNNFWDTGYKYPIKTKSSIWTVKKK